MSKSTMWFPNRSDTNRPVQSQKESDDTIYVVKTKELISCVVTAKLICAFVFAYICKMFPHDAARIPCNYVL